MPCQFSQILLKLQILCLHVRQSESRGTSIAPRDQRQIWRRKWIKKQKTNLIEHDWTKWTFVRGLTYLPRLRRSTCWWIVCICAIHRKKKSIHKDVMYSEYSRYHIEYREFAAKTLHRQLYSIRVIQVQWQRCLRRCEILPTWALHKYEWMEDGRGGDGTGLDGRDWMGLDGRKDGWMDLPRINP